MSFHYFLDYWQLKWQKEFNHNAVATKETLRTTNSNFAEPTAKTENLYLKNWHLKAQMPDYDFYRVPRHFASDWLNEDGKDDYQFVYMGPNESWDIIPRRRLWFIQLVDQNSSMQTLGVASARGRKSPQRPIWQMPLRISEQLLKERLVRYFIIEQTENESLFVPSGRYHQVQNVTDTISVNHNWFNACNLQQIWQNIVSNMRQVTIEIGDCRQMDNFDEHCHTILRASLDF